LNKVHGHRFKFFYNIANSYYNSGANNFGKPSLESNKILYDFHD